MKKTFSIILAAALCLMLATPALAAESDYTFDDGCYFQESEDGSDGLVVDSQGEGRAFYTIPFGDAWSVSFRVDLISGSASDDPEANARLAITNEDFDLLGLITVKTMAGRDEPDTRIEIQQLWDGNWSHLGVIEWTKHTENAYYVTISKLAGDNSLYIVLTDTDGTEFMNGQSNPFNADLMASAKYFGFYVWNSKVEYTEIEYTGFGDSEEPGDPGETEGPEGPEEPDTQPIPPSTVQAPPSKQAIYIDDELVDFDAFLINDRNFLKLRDFALSINGTEKQFSADFEPSEDGIITAFLTRGEEYEPEGNEMQAGDGETKTALLSTNMIFLVDGEEVEILAYNIGGYNYMRVLDLLELFDICAGYEDGVVTIDTTRPFSESSI